MKRPSGFTLIELMITVAVLGILVAIAYPSYTNYPVKGNRGAAKAFLMEVAQTEQQFLLDSRSYVAAADATAVTANLKVTVPPEFSRFYTIAIVADAGPPPAFTATATPKAGTRQAGDGWLAINNAGAKTSEKPDRW